MRVQASFTDENVRDIFLPLLRRLTDLQRQKGGRVLALLAAPPAAGKSTLAALLQELSMREKGLCPMTAIGMDGFHRPQAWLQAHTAHRDGVVLSMAAIKGAPETYDLEAMRRTIRRLAAGEVCGWPRYDRVLHDPVPDALRLTGDLVLLEGNYLLLDEPLWRDLKGYADFTIALRADPALLRRRLIARHIAGGRTPEEAARKTDESDMVNIRLCLTRTLPADLTLTLREDGSFEEVKGPGE